MIVASGMYTIGLRATFTYSQ